MTPIPPAPRRKRGRLLLIAGAVLVGIPALAWWLAEPWMVAAVAARALPRDLGDGLALRAFSLAPGPRADVEAAFTPSRLRRLGMDAVRRWLPPWSARDGMSVDGAFRSTEAPSLRLTLRLRADSDAPERGGIDARIPASGLNAWVAVDSADQPIELPGMTGTWRYALDPGSELVEDGGTEAYADESGGGGWIRCLRVTASGDAWLDLGKKSLHVRVTRLEAKLTLRFRREGEALRPGGFAAIGACDYVLPSDAGVFDRVIAAQLRTIVAVVVNRDLGEQGLARNLLPAWTPIDAAVHVVLVGNLSGTTDFQKRL